MVAGAVPHALVPFATPVMFSRKAGAPLKTERRKMQATKSRRPRTRRTSSGIARFSAESFLHVARSS
jgi:hypothetical protein